MSKKLEWNPLHGSVLAITAITLIGIGLVAAIGTQAVTAGPAAQNLPIKVKTCKVDTSPDPVSCKPLLKSIKDMHLTFDLQLSRVGGEFVITLTPAEPVRTP
jgi:hypothetical protein